MKSLANLKDQVKSLMYKMFINEIDFHRLFDGIFKTVLFLLVESYTVNQRISGEEWYSMAAINSRFTTKYNKNKFSFLW